MSERAVKHVWRLPPCPDYDVEGTESWLTDMAAQGFHLTEEGFFLGVVTFEKGEPRAVRYRLEAAEKTTSMWAEDGGYPDEAAVTLSQNLGWEYVANRGQFYIYRSAEPGARELNTDPAVQALALDIVCKRQRSALGSTLFSFILWGILYPLLKTKGAFFLLMIAMRTWFFLWGAALLFWELGRGIVQLAHLHKLKQQLQAEGWIDHQKDWKKRAGRYHIGNFIRRGLTLLWFLLLLLYLGSYITEERKIPLADYSGDPPFATMADLAGDSGSYELQHWGFSNTVEIWSDWLTPVNYDWDEIADVTLPDGRQISGGLYIYYHEARSPALARAIAEEYLRKDRYENTFNLFAENDFKSLDLAPLDVDFSAAYSNELHFPTIVLQDGCHVLRAYWYQTSQNKLSLDEWAAILADSIKVP